MSTLRGIHKCTVLGKPRTLRKNLPAIAEIEDRLDTSIDVIIHQLEDPDRPKFKFLLVMFEEMCAAGGTPLTTDEINNLVPEDTQEISEAVGACLRLGSVEEADPNGPPVKSPNRKARRSVKSAGAAGKK